MKKRILSLLAVLALIGILAAPALAWESPPAKYRTFEQYLDFYRAQSDADTQALSAYLDRRLAEGLSETFDADAYFEQTMARPEMGITRDNWLSWNNDWNDAAGAYDEEWFRSEMLDTYLTSEYRTWRETNSAQILAERWPEEYAAFDPDTWFAGYYSLAGLTPEAYMARAGLNAEAFKLDMFQEWAAGERCRFNGYCVTVNGTPIQFQLYRDLDGEIAAPKAENERILIPLRSAAESLDLEVEYQEETGKITCAGKTNTVIFTLDSPEYSGGTLDVAPRAEKGVTYLPLRALAEALGLKVTWNQAFQTAQLAATG